MTMTTAIMMMISVMKPNYVFEELVNGLSTYPKLYYTIPERGWLWSAEVLYCKIILK